MRKLPKGLNSYEQIIKEDRIYVDKTMYIEKLENVVSPAVMFLRPKKFGKTLFASTLEGFRKEVSSSIELFVKKYGIDFYINKEENAEFVLDELFTAFIIQKPNEKLYIIIDDYDFFANEFFDFKMKDIKNLSLKTNRIRPWYEILKKGTETIVNRIFITGTLPMNLDSFTSGFNIEKDLTKNINFNDMLGFCEEDVKYLMRELEIDGETQEKMLPIIKNNYGGYVFSNDIDLDADVEKYKMCNSNMVLYFFDSYKKEGNTPEQLADKNIIGDCVKLENLVDLCRNITKKIYLRKWYLVRSCGMRL